MGTAALSVLKSLVYSPRKVATELANSNPLSLEMRSEIYHDSMELFDVKRGFAMACDMNEEH